MTVPRSALGTGSAASRAPAAAASARVPTAARTAAAEPLTIAKVPDGPVSARRPAARAQAATALRSRLPAPYLAAIRSTGRYLR